MQNEPLTNKTISSTTVQLMQFQEDFLGKNAQKPPLTRIPVSINSQYYDNSITKLISIL